MTRCNIVDNGTYGIYLTTQKDSVSTLFVANNYWGVNDSASIEDMVYHHADSSALPTICYMPFAEIPFNIEDPDIASVWWNLPKGYTLGQNYPNPFNQATTIEYSLKSRQFINLTVFNILGQRICRLYSGEKPAGTYNDGWDGRDDYGKSVASGIYFYRIQSEDFTETRKMLLLK